MAAFAEYIRNIAVYMIFMSCASMFAPNARWRGYVDLLLNLILIILVAAPLGSLLSTFASGSFNGLSLSYTRSVIEKEAAYYDEEQRGRVLAAYEEELKTRMTELVEEDGSGYEYAGGSFDISTGDGDFGEIRAIYLLLAEKENAKPFIRIETVEPVMPFAAPVGGEAKGSDFSGLKKNISDFYNVPEDNIYISIRVGHNDTDDEE